MSCVVVGEVRMRVAYHFGGVIGVEVDGKRKGRCSEVGEGGDKWNLPLRVYVTCRLYSHAIQPMTHGAVHLESLDWLGRSGR